MAVRDVALLARIVFVVLIASLAWGAGTANAQTTTTVEPSEDCPTITQMVSDADAVVVGEVIEVRQDEADGEDEGGDIVVLRIIDIGKGGAQNPLLVHYPSSETVPDLEADFELNVIINYSVDGSARSTLACGRTTNADDEALIELDSNDLGSFGETAGNTAQVALRAAALLGVGVIGVTLIWRVFREFRPPIG